MELISSDTNIWIDFAIAECVEEPFKLKDKYKYVMSVDALRDEMLSPPELRERLIELGLEGVEITETEYELTNAYLMEYKQLSVYDSMALSIAKRREIKLLTGDGALRTVAKKEGVEVHGTLWLLDELFFAGMTGRSRCIEMLNKLSINNGKRIRLPEGEIDRRLKDLYREKG